MEDTKQKTESLIFLTSKSLGSFQANSHEASSYRASLHHFQPAQKLDK
jgi:hypothetical protein